MKVRYTRLFTSYRLDDKLPPSGSVTIFHPGRGGISDGKLDTYNSVRVGWTLEVARAVASLRPGADIQLIWAGGCNRQQDRAGLPLVVSEAGAALAYARARLRADDRFIMRAEEVSTSTVENATASAKFVRDGDTIIVVTDPQHYRLWKVQFIMWLVYPNHRRIYVALPTSPPDTNWKKIAVHAVSTCVTVLGMARMILGNRGNADAIQDRQKRLQQRTRH